MLVRGITLLRISPDLVEFSLSVPLQPCTTPRRPERNSSPFELVSFIFYTVVATTPNKQKLSDVLHTYKQQFTSVDFSNLPTRWKIRDIRNRTHQWVEISILLTALNYFTCTVMKTSKNVEISCSNKNSFLLTSILADYVTRAPVVRTVQRRFCKCDLFQKEFLIVLVHVTCHVTEAQSIKTRNHRKQSIITSSWWFSRKESWSAMRWF